MAIDRLERSQAGRRLAVWENGQVTAAPPGAREGYVYCWTGKSWSRNRTEERRRLANVRMMLDSMKASDPGGNINLNRR